VVESTHGILKKSHVRPAGAYTMNAGPAVAPPPPVADKSDVRLVEQHPDHAILEVRCACGRVTYVQCRWPIPGAAAPTVANAAPTNA
jgi:hypothetical protein